MSRRWIVFGFCASLLLNVARAQDVWHVERTIEVGGVGGMDYLTVDSATHRLFVPRGTHTLVLDAGSGKTIADIPGQTKAHGVAVVPKSGRGFITDGGGAGYITVFDLKTYTVLGVLTAMPDADGIIYDAGTDHILVSAGDSNSLITFKPDIDPRSGKIDKPIPLGGAPEFLAADGKGRVYVNLEDKDTVAAVDLNSRTVVARWPVSPGGAPVGIALSSEQHTLFIGCRKPQKMIVMNTDNGAIRGDISIGAGVDAIGVLNKQAFASTGDGMLAIVDQSPDGKFTLSQSLRTAFGAKTLGIDASADKIYLPTSDFEKQTPGATGRPKAKQGTFKILVVSR